MIDKINALGIVIRLLICLDYKSSSLVQSLEQSSASSSAAASVVSLQIEIVKILFSYEHNAMIFLKLIWKLPVNWTLCLESWDRRWFTNVQSVVEFFHRSIWWIQCIVNVMDIFITGNVKCEMARITIEIGSGQDARFICKNACGYINAWRFQFHSKNLYQIVFISLCTRLNINTLIDHCYCSCYRENNQPVLFRDQQPEPNAPNVLSVQICN